MKHVSKKGHHSTWGIDEMPGYPYYIFNKKHRESGVWPEKIFHNITECNPDYFHILTNARPKGLVPTLLGKKAGETITCDLVQKNTLIAGQTRSGKTCFLQNIVLSMLYWGHHDYMKIVILDTKAAAFKNLSRVVTLVDNHEDVAKFLESLEKELRKRINRTKQLNAPHDAKKANEMAFRYEKPHLAMPYIMVIFDEFADFMQFSEEKKKEGEDENNSSKLIQTLASLGLGLGINLTFATQAPYKEYIKGVIKNNFERRITFSLGDFYQEQLILGKKRPGEEEEAQFLKCGEFYKREQGQRIRHMSPYAGEFALKNAEKNLLHWGFDFRLKI